MSSPNPTSQPSESLPVELQANVGAAGALEKGQRSVESLLDDITQLACALCQTPVALVCSRDQQGWRLAHNLGSPTEPLAFDLAFYTFAVTQRRAFEISDLRSDPAFSNSPLVTGAPHFRFFSGIPVTSEDDQLLGAICVLDTRPRSLSPPQRTGMQALARQVRTHLLHERREKAHIHAQAEAHEQQRQWRRMFDSASIGMAQIHPDGSWMEVNGALCATLGYTVNDLLATRPGRIVFPDDVESSQALLRKITSGEIPSCSAEKRLLDKTGRPIWCSIHVTLVRNADGEPAYFLAHVIDISEMRQAQEGWRDAELRSKALLEMPVPVGILTTDFNGTTTYANRHVEQLTGFSAAELTDGRAITSLFLDKELREHSQNLARMFGAVAHGQQIVLEHARCAGPETREWTWLRKDGTPVRIILTVNAIPNAHGGISGFALAAIAAARPNEGAPGTQEGRFHIIADSAPLGMFLTDAHGKCTYANEAFRQITALAPDQTSGYGWQLAFHPEDRAAFEAEFQKAMRRGSDFVTELRLARAGDTAWVRVRGREIFFEDVAQGYVGTLEDITASRQIIQKVTAGEERLRNFLTSAPFSVALIDRDRKCSFASVGWLDLHHRSWHEVNGRPIFELIPEARERLEDLFRRALNGGTNLAHEQQVRLGEGPVEYLRWQMFPWRSSGEIVGVGMYEERLTQQMRTLADAEAAREAAETASRIKSEFLAEVATELKTPGAGIIGLADMLLETDTDPQRREYAEMVKTSIGSWLKLASDLYDFSKLESRKVEVEFLPFNLMDGLNQSMRRLAVAAENKGLELVCATAPDLPTVVVGDGTRLFQIVSHLVLFAIDVASKGEIVISVSPGEHNDPNPSLPSAMEFQFVVRDSSGWLTDSKLADIQQVILLVEKSPALKKVGTSLGIVLAARLVNLLNGKLWIERKDQSAAFHFVVPLGGKRQPPARSLLTDVAVLIGDDSVENRTWLHQLTGAWGMKPTALEKPGSIIDVLEIANEARRPFRFVLLDAHVPDCDTFAFASQIKEESVLNITPIMLLSPSMRSADENRARELGLEHWLTKPVNANELRELLERVLGGRPAAVPPTHTEFRRRSSFQKPRLNVLLVDNSRLNQEVAMGVFGQKGHRLTVAQNGKEAVAIMQRRSCDMVLLGLDTPGEDSLETLAAIRQNEKEAQKSVRVFGLTSNREITTGKSALTDATDGFLPNPIQPKDLSLLLDQIEPDLESGI